MKRPGLWRRGLERVDQALAPDSCAFCGIWSCPPGVRVCAGCRCDLPWIEHACPRCAQPSQTRLHNGVDCAACQLRPPPLKQCIAPLHYTFPVDAAIKSFKFRRRLEYGPAFAKLLQPSLERMDGDVDALLPVPLHWRRQALRGFNQADELCRPLAKASGIKVVAVARRVRSTEYQSGLHATERRSNLRSAFAVRGRLERQHILIVDDVITTGATVWRLAEVLLAAGAGSVSALALARATRD